MDELFEKFQNHYFPENEEEEKQYLIYLDEHPFEYGSYPYFKRQIKQYLSNKYSKDNTVLDIGCGYGTYFYLLKDNFDTIDGIEGNKEVINNSGLTELYSNLFNVDACEFKFDHYNIITMGDCLEHIEYDKAVKLVEYLYDRCDELIIAIPYNLPMESPTGSPYASHKQPDLTVGNMEERYPLLKLKWANEYIGVYTK